MRNTSREFLGIIFVEVPFCSSGRQVSVVVNGGRDFL